MQNNVDWLAAMHFPLADGFPHHFPGLLSPLLSEQLVWKSLGVQLSSVPHEKIRCAVHFCMNLTDVLFTQGLLATGGD